MNRLITVFSALFNSYPWYISGLRDSDLGLRGSWFNRPVGKMWVREIIEHRSPMSISMADTLELGTKPLTVDTVT